MSIDDDLSRSSLLDLFREEAQTQTHVLSDGLLALEHAPTDAAQLEACMRAAHSLKGAARIIGLQDGVDIAHLMEECFVAAQTGALLLSTAHVDELLRGVDLLLRAGNADTETALGREEVDVFIARLTTFSDAANDAHALRADTAGASPWGTTYGASEDPDDDATMRAALAILGADAAKLPVSFAEPTPDVEAPAAKASAAEPSITPTPSLDAPLNLHSARDPERMLRVRSDNLDRLLSLSGESLVESRWLKPFAESMLRVKRTQRDAARALDTCFETLAERLDPQALAALDSVRRS